MKVALLLGVEIHVNTSFDGLIEPPTDQSQSMYILGRRKYQSKESCYPPESEELCRYLTLDGLIEPLTEKYHIIHKVTPPL